MCTVIGNIQSCLLGKRPACFRLEGNTTRCQLSSSAFYLERGIRRLQENSKGPIRGCGVAACQVGLHPALVLPLISVDDAPAAAGALVVGGTGVHAVVEGRGCDVADVDGLALAAVVDAAELAELLAAVLRRVGGVARHGTRQLGRRRRRARARCRRRGRSRGGCGNGRCRDE